MNNLEERKHIHSLELALAVNGKHISNPCLVFRDHTLHYILLQP
jgi:hypothetical protein